MYNSALDIGLRRSEFEGMTLAEFFWLLEIHNRKETNSYMKLRLILGAQLGKDPRRVFPMKGDFNHLKSQKGVAEDFKRRGLDKIVGKVGFDLLKDGKNK